MTHRTKKFISYILTLAIVIIAAFPIYRKFARLLSVEFTDNATIQQQIIPINSRVRGYIAKICFEEYQPINKGDTLVIIDNSEMLLLLAQAKADYQNAIAGKSVAHRSVSVAAAQQDVNEASIAEAEVVKNLAIAEFERYQSLLEKGAVTRQQFDVIKSDMEAKTAKYDMLVRQRNASATVVDESKQRISQNEAGIQLAEANLKTAQLNLSYCVIVSPVDGYASRKEIQEGQLIQPGQRLLDVIDASDVWVNANFKETQLPHISPGSKVTVKVDAIPEVEFKGIVESISRATGASLSLIPQDNSSGNFIKVRQRIPVRIKFSSDNNPKEMEKLRAGMNVECEIKY